MTRRSLIPLAFLAVLTALTAVFAVVGATAAPSAETVTIQNATAKTFGTPTGANSFAMEFFNTVTPGGGAGTQSDVRLVNYVAPNRMAVYAVGNPSRLLGVVPRGSISCAVSAYTAVVGGSTPWAAAKGNSYTRSESYADYSARIPQTSGSTCEPRPSSVEGTVTERAVVRAGYLVAVRVSIVVPPQTLSNGQTSTHGTQNETYVLLQINGTSTRKLVSS